MARRTRPLRRGVRARRAARRAVSGLVAAVLAVALQPVPAQAAEAGLGSGPSARTLRWKVTSTPFRLAVLDHGRPLVAQATGDTAGPGGRMAYALADGTT